MKTAERIFKNDFNKALTPANDNNPIGTILIWGGNYNSKPDGYLFCNGDTIYYNEFPELCAKIQDYWGPMHEGGKHTLPDLRGMFLRGVNGSIDGVDADPDLKHRHSSNGNPNDVGSWQPDAFQGHYHSHSWDPHVPSYGGANNTDGGGERNGHFETELSITQATRDPDCGEPRISRETRPKNVYVFYLIKAK